MLPNTVLADPKVGGAAKADRSFHVSYLHPPNLKGSSLNPLPHIVNGSAADVKSYADLACLIR